MHLSIIKVHGLSMAPFFQSDDVLLVRNIKDENSLSIGSCIVQNGLAHRLVTSNLIKGDRLLYFDNHLLNLTEGKVVLGRLISKNNQDFFSSHNHMILKSISFAIAIFSRVNREKYFFRPMAILVIISLSKIHRSLESNFIHKKSPKEMT